MAVKNYWQLSCREAGSDCDFLVRAESQDELWAIVSAHGARMHNVKEFTPDLKSKITSAIKTILI